MKFSTGKYSNQVSAGQKAAYSAALVKNKPTARQVRYLKFLMAKCQEGGVDISKAVGKMQIHDKQEHNIAIDKLRKALIEAGININQTERQKQYEANRKRYAKKKTIEALTTEWIYMTEKKPDRHFVNTLDEDGFVRIFEWNGKYFLDCNGNPIITGRHRFKTPIAWARLG